MKARPIWQAYNDTGALAVPCPRRGAERGKWCTREDGLVRRIPCVTRASATGVGSGNRPRDFSEPLAGQREDR